MTPSEFRAIRQRLGLNQDELARLLGYGRGQRVSEFERATNPRPVPRLLALVMQALDDDWRPKEMRDAK